MQRDVIQRDADVRTFFVNPHQFFVARGLDLVPKYPELFPTLYRNTTAMRRLTGADSPCKDS